MKKVLIKGGFITLMAALALLAGCLSYSVDSVEVSIEGNATSIDAGKTIQFNFLVNASGKDTSQAQRVKWTVSSTSDGKGPVTPGTSISPSGTLAVSADEIYPVLYVRATHEYYSGKYDFKQIQVKGPKVGSVVMSVTGNASAVAGGTAKLSAFVAGQAPNQGLTYSVGSKSDGTGAVVAGTSVAGDGTLTVSANETATSLYVKAVSNSDATKFDIKEIKVVTVTGVTVSAEGGTAKVVRGGRLNFSAVVAGNNEPAQTVTWKVSSNAAGTGTVTDGTSISSNGTLTVAAAEASATLYVTATSTVNTAKSGTITVTIPTVTSVSVSPVNPTIKRGDGQTFTARVQGTGGPGQEVTWKLDGVGGTPSATTITSNGMLIVSTAETLSGLIVTATSVDDPSKFGTSMVTIPATPAAIVPATPAPQVQTPASGGTDTYNITGSGTTFTATKGGAAVGNADQPIQNVINAIRNHAKGAACAIQFGNGTAVLDIGTASIDLNNSGGTWGAVTLSGKITSAVADVEKGTIVINAPITVTVPSGAEIGSVGNGTNTSRCVTVNIISNGTLNVSGGTVKTTGGYAVYNQKGTVNISGGTVQSTGNYTYTVYNYTTNPINITGGTVSSSGGGSITVFNRLSGAVNISGGTVSATGASAKAVENEGPTGAINISGGTVSARTGQAVSNYSTSGKVTVSGTANITSANTNSYQATIYIQARSGATDSERLVITGGKVENTSATTDGNAIRNDSIGSVTISGGTVSKVGTSGFAVLNNSTGVVKITTPPAVINGAVQLVKP